MYYFLFIFKMFQNCPLCLSPNQNFEFKEEFTQCSVCHLIFREPKESFTGLGEKKSGSF